MKKFSKITSYAAVMSDINIDTDIIIPKQFLKTIERTGLGKNLFYDKRYIKNYEENIDFILNKHPWRNCKILIAGDNFGCGSSREHAPWALLDFGIECIISTSFADIFFNNSTKNGLFPLKIGANEIKKIVEYADSKKEITIDLPNQIVICGKIIIEFKVEKTLKERLMQGLDDIELTLKLEKEISAYESNYKKKFKWKDL